MSKVHNALYERCYLITDFRKVEIHSQASWSESNNNREHRRAKTQGKFNVIQMY